MFVAGVDGCKKGWVVALRELATGATSISVVTTFADVLALPDTGVIAVDIPIGFLDAAASGGRECERVARPLLGHPRRSSVFSAPVRSALSASAFAQACSLNRASSAIGLGISQQCFALFDKLREVDAAMTSAQQARVFEVHPELCFYEMAGGAAAKHRKKSTAGRTERIHLLSATGFRAPSHAPSGAAMDDVLDALAACWTAQRIHARTAIQLPAGAVPLDARGLRMELWR